jgi:hypothetical protein
MRFVSRIFFCVLVAFSISVLSGATFAQQTDQTMKPAKTVKPAKVKVDPGLKKYGNVTFADPAHHKYPIDNAKHIRGAWSSIHAKRNAAKYKPEELAEVKKRIRDAGTAKGITLKEKK